MAQNQERRVEMNKSSRTTSGRGSLFARFTNHWMTGPGLGMKAFGPSRRFSPQLWRSSRRAQLVQKGGHSPSHLRERPNRVACLARSIAPLDQRTSQHQQTVSADLYFRRAFIALRRTQAWHTRDDVVFVNA